MLAGLLQRKADDYLPAFMVKELRQSLRARHFSNLFMWTQGLLCLAVLAAVVSDSQGDMNQICTVGFWSALIIPLLFVIPIRALRGFYSEDSEDVFELLYLTRLSGFKIVLGKWLALVAESSLFVVALLPYAVLRYFLGGVNIVESAAIMAVVWAASAFLTAFALACFLSGKSKSPIVFLLIVGAIGLQVLAPYLGGLGAFIISRGSSGRVAGSFGAPEIMLSLIYCGLFLILFLEAAASRIAPPYENHAIKKRLLGLVILAVGALLVLMNIPAKGGICIVSALTVLPLCVAALCEKPTWILSIYIPFVRFGILGRMAGRFFYPGWQAGIFYTLLIVSLLVLLFCLVLNLDGSLAIALGVAFIATLIMPLPLMAVFAAKSSRPMSAYIAIQLILAFIAVVIWGIAAVLHEDLSWLPYLMPQTIFVLLMEDTRPFSIISLVMVTLPVTVILFIVTFVRAQPVLSRIHELEKEAKRFSSFAGKQAEE